MPYTICSRGRILGTTDLGFIYRENGFRCGWLEPTELGERLLPRATGVSPAMRTEWIIGPDATAHADVLSAIDQEQALALELRREDGSLIETEHVAVIDTEYVLSIPIPDYDDEPELDEETQAEIDEMVEEFNSEPYLESARESESKWMRYQVQVRLVDHNAIP